MGTRQFILHHGKRHPNEMGASEIHAFLTHLAVERGVAASTRNQARNALAFPYQSVLEDPAFDSGQFERAHRPKKIPVVLGKDEIRRERRRRSGH